MTPVSLKAKWACAAEPSFVDVTYLSAGAAILAEGGVAAFGVTAWIVAGLERNSLESNILINSLFIDHRQYLLIEEMETVVKNRHESIRGL